MERIATTLPPALEIASDPEVVGCTLGEGSALLNLRTNIYYSLNAVGAFVWDRLVEAGAERVTFAALVAAVREAYDAPVDVVEADIARLVTDLEAAGLVRCTRG
ncbi:PqqD family protein [Erythrobacter sp. NE805]|uniref:PqqD family protein n=1 Tax=Erythrobacter sp. NE805 TaxID=3389875 RepID=UPI00396AF705